MYEKALTPEFWVDNLVLWTTFELMGFAFLSIVFINVLIKGFKEKMPRIWWFHCFSIAAGVLVIGLLAWWIVYDGTCATCGIEAYEPSVWVGMGIMILLFNALGSAMKIDEIKPQIQPA